MDHEKALAVFEDFKIRRVNDEKTETWYFSVVDIIAALIQQPDYQSAREFAEGGLSFQLDTRPSPTL